jgi:hypothetical protein
MLDRRPSRPLASLAVALAAAVLLVVACGRKTEEAPAPAPAPPPAAPQGVTVATVELGNSIGADKRVTAPATTFAPADTIYASVDTTGSAPSATLAARWTYEDGQVVNESSQTIAPTGPATTEFHISKPDGWPAGSYKVEILLNGTSATSKSFTVQ